MTDDPKRSSTLYVSLLVVFVILLGNWIVMGMIFGMQGGFAEIGNESNGHFYLGNHGRYTEVSESTFFWNLWYFRISSTAAILSFVMLATVALITGRCRSK